MKVVGLLEPKQPTACRKRRKVSNTEAGGPKKVVGSGSLAGFGKSPDHKRSTLGKVTPVKAKSQFIKNEIRSQSKGDNENSEHPKKAVALDRKARKVRCVDRHVKKFWISYCSLGSRTVIMLIPGPSILQSMSSCFFVRLQVVNILQCSTEISVDRSPMLTYVVCIAIAGAYGDS